MTRWLAVLGFAAASMLTMPALADDGHDEPDESQSEQEGGGANHAEHEVDWNLLVWQTIDFAIVVALLIYMGRKPLKNFLVTRHEQVAQALAEAQELKIAAEKKHAEYKSRLDGLNREIDALRAEMVRAGEAERDRIVAEAEQKAARLRKETAFVIEQQMKALRTELTREAVEAAIGAAREVLTKEASPADQDRIAKQYTDALSRGARS